MVDRSATVVPETKLLVVTAPDVVGLGSAVVVEVVPGRVEVLGGTVVVVSGTVVVVGATVVVVGATVVVVVCATVVVVVGATVVVVVGATVVVVVGATVVVVVGATVVVVVGATVVVVGATVVVAVATQEELVNWFVSRVTAPSRAKARPSMDAEVFIVIDVCARTLPMKAVPEPRVADDPTCQKTLQACTPPVSTTAVPVPVTNVLPAWKTKTELLDPLRVSGTGPVSAIELAA